MLVFIFKMNEMASTFTEILNQLMIFVQDLVEYDIVIYSIHNFLIDSHRFRLNSLEIFALYQIKFFTKERVAILNKEVNFFENVISLVFVQSVRMNILRESNTFIKLLCLYLQSICLQLSQELLIITIVFKFYRVFFHLVRRRPKQI